MKNFVQLKHILLGGAAVGMFMVPALAQQQTEVVTVTGIRASLQSAQAVKQNSDQVVDAISSVDIGALPDRNVAEALQRVPGVVLTRTSGANELTGMGSLNTSIMVRGLSWVKSLVNGHDEFTAGSGRTLSFSDVSADLLSGVEVYKSPTAKMIEGGVGGVVDLKTRRPFDQDGQMIAISGDYTYGDLSDRATPSVNGLYSNRWNTALGEFGILASVDWQDQRNRTSGVRLSDYKCWNNEAIYNNDAKYNIDGTIATPATVKLSKGSNTRASDANYSSCMSQALDTSTDHSSGRLMGPSGWDYRQIDEHQQRLASDLVLQWRPNDKLEITLSGLNSYAYTMSTAHYVSVNISYDQLKAGHLSNGTWTGSQSSLNDFDSEAGSGHNRNSDISLNVKYNPTEALEITADVQFVESSSPSRHMGINTTAQDKPTYQIDVSSGEPVISYTSPATMSSRSNYYWSAAMDHLEYDVGHSANARIDATYKFQGNGLLGLFKSVEAGFRTEQKLAVARADGWNWGALSQTWQGNGLAYLDGTTGCYHYADSDIKQENKIWTKGGCSFAAADGVTYTSATGTMAKVNTMAEYFNYGKILGNSMPSLWIAGKELTAMNTIDSYKLLSSVELAANGNAQNWQRWIGFAAEVGCTGDDATCSAAYQNVHGSNSSGNRNNTTQEQTYAGYAQITYAHDNFFGYDIPIDGNIGVRIVRTEDTVGSGKLVMPYLNRTCAVGDASKIHATPKDLDKAVDSCAGYDAAVHFLTGLDLNGLAATTTQQAQIDSAVGAVVDRPAVDNGYTDIMPSFNFVAHLTDQVQTRLAYSETIVRPSFSDMNASASLNFNFYDASYYQKGLFENDPSGSGGNPHLKPMRARNYDASVEWYFAPTGNVSLSLFHKDLSDYFHSATLTESFTHPISGQKMDFQYTTYVNTAKGKIEGFELSYTQFYDQLPGFLGGFGLQANYTKIYNSGGVNGAGDVGNVTSSANAQSKLPIEGMSNDSYNLALMYSKYNIDARLAWNWRCHYLSSTSDADTKLPVWVENYGQLDGSIFYSFLENYKIGFQITNITGSEYYGDRGYEDYHPRAYTVEAERKLSIVFRSLF